jgi:hypothetical protein
MKPTKVTHLKTRILSKQLKTKVAHHLKSRTSLDSFLRTRAGSPKPLPTHTQACTLQNQMDKEILDIPGFLQRAFPLVPALLHTLIHRDS